MSAVQARKVHVVEVSTPSPSPFARSLLFGYVGMFLYESDAPLAERRAAAPDVRLRSRSTADATAGCSWLLNLALVRGIDLVAVPVAEHQPCGSP